MGARRGRRGGYDVVSDAVAKNAPRYAILVGVVATMSLELFLKDLQRFQVESIEVIYLDVILLDNGCCPITRILDDLAVAGLRVHVMTREEQEHDCKQGGIFGEAFGDVNFDGCRSNATTHSLLQHYLRSYADSQGIHVCRYSRSVVCILDDDNRLTDTVAGEACKATNTISVANCVAAELQVYEEGVGASIKAAIAVCGMMTKRMAAIRTGLARCTLKAVGAPIGMCVLGCGGEGIVFATTDDGSLNAGVAWKVMDKYALRADPAHEELVLTPLVDVPTNSLVRVAGLSRGNGLVLVLERALVFSGLTESGSPPAPSAAALIHLLCECRRCGVVLRNIKLDNFVGDVFIDIGLDIMPFDRAEWEYMAKQLFVCLHWPGRVDLLQLRGSDFSNIPELRGLHEFRAAVAAAEQREDENDSSAF